MVAYPQILKTNPNYRRLWLAQVISEMGDWFNQVAAFTVAIYYTHSALAVTWVLISQTVPSVVIGPLAGVVLDRVNRKQALVISDVVRALVALGPILITSREHVWWLYPLTVLLASASPFFNAGRLALIPSITEAAEILSANSITQATHSATLGIGSAIAGFVVARYGFRNAFILNSISFLGSAFFISRIVMDWSDQPATADTAVAQSEQRRLSPLGGFVAAFREFREGLQFIKSEPLALGLVLVGVGWATGGGAMQVLFSVFGDLVFHRGAFGIGVLYGAAGTGLALAAAAANWFGKRLSFKAYKRTITICYFCYGTAYVLFSTATNFWIGVWLIGISRYFIGTSSVLNLTRLMRIVPDEFRGRVFATNETMTLTTMLLSMIIAGSTAHHFGARAVAATAGVLSGSTGIWWGLANWRGKLREPKQYAIGLGRVEEAKANV